MGIQLLVTMITVGSCTHKRQSKVKICILATANNVGTQQLVMMHVSIMHACMAMHVNKPVEGCWYQRANEISCRLACPPRYPCKRKV